MKFILYIFFFITTFRATAQQSVVDVMPKFPGPDHAYYMFINSNLKYPASAMEQKLTGKAFIQFLIDTSGSVTSVKVVKSSGHKVLDDEAIRVVSKMPRWIPAVHQGTKVNFTANIPISFKIQGEELQDPAIQNMSSLEREIHEKAMKFWKAGNNLQEEGKYELALEKFNQSLEAEKNNKYSLFDKAKVLMVLGKKDEACNIWESMSKEGMRKEECEEFLTTYCRTDNGTSKMTSFYNKQKANSFFKEAMNTYSSGRYEASVRKFDSCLKYQPDHLDALYNKAAVHFKLDQKKAACSTWNKLLAIKADDIEVQNLVKKHCN